MTEVRDELRAALRRLLAKRSDSAAVRKAVETDLGYDADLWRTLCDQIGVAALAVPEEYGGAGASVAEAGVVLDELGRTLTPSPLLGSVIATELLLALGDGAAAERVLPRVAAGEVVALAWADESGWHDGAVAFEAGRLTGTAHYVLDGDTADLLLIVTPAGVVEAAPAAATRTATPAMDLTRRLATVSFDAAPGDLLAGDHPAALRRAREVAATALAVEAVGAMTRLLELTVEYAKVRVQFGRPIGSFQAIKHRLADLHVLVETSRSAAYAALAGDLNPSVAKAYCCESFATVAGEAIQLHGGIAITWEHDAHLYFKRAHGSAHLFGSPDEHVAGLAPAVVARESE